MGEEEVILVRDRKKELHVFLNTCRHRGMKVCRYDDGNTLVFTCPFHGWSYDTDGRLVGVPYYDAAYKGDMDKKEWGLHEVAQMSNYYGSIWATWDRKAPPFEDYLGPFAPWVRRCFQSSDGNDNGVELFKPAYKWRIPTNWKFPGFSFDGDSAHGAMTHRSVNVAAIGPQGERRRRQPQRHEQSVPADELRDVQSRARPWRAQPHLRAPGRATVCGYLVYGARCGRLLPRDAREIAAKKFEGPVPAWRYLPGLAECQHPAAPHPASGIRTAWA